MWRYIIMAVSVIGAATQYPVLFQKEADRIVAAREEGPAMPAEPVSVATRENRAENPLAGRVAHIAQDGRGHFKVEARLNGRAERVLVDTGATLVAINESTARRIGFRLAKDEFRYTVNTANGQTQAAEVVIEQISIGRVEVRDVRAMVLSDKALSSTLLGMSFLKQLRKFEYSGGSLVLTQ